MLWIMFYSDVNSLHLSSREDKTGIRRIRRITEPSWLVRRRSPERLIPSP